MRLIAKILGILLVILAAAALWKRDEIARLQDRLNSAKKGAASERDALRAAQANLEVLKTTGGATEKQIARQQASVDKQMAAYERQRNVALRLRAELNKKAGEQGASSYRIIEARTGDSWHATAELYK